MHYLKCSFSEKAYEKQRNIFSENVYDTSVLEAFALLSVLETYQGKHVNLVELGSGRAPWCLSVAGALRHGLISRNPSSYFVLALEGHPTSFQWSREHIHAQYINGIAVHGAIGEKDGMCRFASLEDPASNMGSHVSKAGNIEVPMIALDTLCEQYGLNNIHIVHMDVQGMEVNALKGASRSIKDGKLDYLMIGTHGKDLEKRLSELLHSTHDLVLGISKGESRYFSELQKTVQATSDGFFVFRRRAMGGGQTSDGLPVVVGPSHNK
jgi:FkbM family methyltransferase